MLKKIVIGFVAFLLVACSEERSESSQMTDFLPEQTALVLQLQEPDLFLSNLKNNEFIAQNADFGPFKKISEKLTFLKYFQKQDQALIAFVNSTKDSLQFLYITKGELQPVPLDSIKNKSIETEKSDFAIKKYVLEGFTSFTASKNGITVLSTSRDLLLESLQNEKPLKDFDNFEKVYKAASRKKPSIFLNHQLLKRGLKKWIPEANFYQFSGWTVVDVDLSQEALKFNGISVAQDTLPSIINIFKNTTPVENKLAQLTPVEALSFTSFTFDNFQQLQKNLQIFNRYSKDSLASSEEVRVMTEAVEVGKITLEKGLAIAVRSKDPDGTNFQVEPNANLLESFREIDIFEYPQKEGLKNVLGPLLSFEEQRYFAFVEPFFIFSEDPEVIKFIITAVKNEQVLGESAAFQNTAASLSSEASILVVNNNRGLKNANSEAPLENMDFQNFPLSAFQAVHQGDFAHIHAVLSKNSEVKAGASVVQTSAIHLEKELAGQPVFFKNHRSKGMDVAIQDLSNTLYLISSTGKIFWKKSLESRILGEVKTVDILKNGRFQLAFATENALNVIDREGNNVSPFPLKFRDAITQPLAVFDYDNKRDYRFVIIQKNRVYMYDRKGKSVKGFDFDKAGAEILLPPKHIRIGRKDYLVFADESGRLNILSRTGKVRVPVGEKIEFSENEWYEYNENFVSMDNSGSIVHVDEKGNLRKENSGFSENSQLVATENLLVRLSENELQIKENKIDLDFGLYTPPQIFLVNNKYYISTTDLQAHKVYLFDSQAELIPGFPVYGNSMIDLNNADSDPALEMAVKGDNDTVLLYEVN